MLEEARQEDMSILVKRGEQWLMGWGEMK